MKELKISITLGTGRKRSKKVIQCFIDNAEKFNHNLK